MASCLCCANFCSVFALTGIVFLVIIGILLQKQPIYIKGVHSPESDAQACYAGAAIYFAVWALSIITIAIDHLKQRARGPVDGEEPIVTKTYGGKTYGATSTVEKR